MADTAMKTKVQILVIGSGFGGAIAAQRLTEGGCQVMLLERGPWRDTLPNRSVGMTDLAPLPQGIQAFTHGLRSVRSRLFRRQVLVNRKGFVEICHGKGVNVICSSNVGGGSHIYAAMLARPASSTYWDGHHPQVSQAGMERYYGEIIQQLGARAATEADDVPNRISLTDHGGKLSTAGLASPMLGILLPERPGEPVSVVNTHGVERQECDYRNNSVLGSPSGAKTTLDFSVLWPAIQRGLQVHDLCEATVIRRAPDRAGYEVEVLDHRTKRTHRVQAAQVVLAAGCVNTVRLLLESRDMHNGLLGMPKLGWKFGTNGGYFAFWKENADRDLSRGLPLCGPFRSAGSPSQSVQMLRAAIQGLERIPLPARLRHWLRRNSFLVGLGKDNNAGVVQLIRGRLNIHYEKKLSPVYQEIDHEVEQIQLSTGTRVFAPGAPITVQPLGGACLGATINDGVIDGNGEVFDNPGLFIADAAALPVSPGRPPSLTIAAWAAHVSDRLLAAIDANSH